MEERSAAIDAVRVLGMITVVASHIYGVGFAPSAITVIASSCVPLFFVLSGYLSSSRRPIRVEIANRARSLLVPYAAWLLIVGLVVFIPRAIRGQFSLIDVGQNLWGGMFLGRPFWAFWFAPALFVAIVLYRLIRPLPLVWQWVIAAAAVAVVVYVPGQPLVYLPFSIAQGVSAIVFVVAGRTIRVLSDRVTRRVLLGVGLLALGLVSVLVLPSDFVDTAKLSFGVPVVNVLATTAISGGVILIADAGLRIRGKAAKVITWLAMASLTVMFVHVPVAVAMDGFGSHSTPIFVATLVISWAIGLILLLVPGGWILTGIPVNRARRATKSVAA